MARPPAPRVRPAPAVARVTPARSVPPAAPATETGLHDDDGDDTLDVVLGTAELQQLGGTSEYSTALARHPRSSAEGPRAADRPRAAGARVIEVGAPLSERPEPAARRALSDLGRGARAAAEALVISWLTIIIPVVAGYVATVTAPSLGEASWADAARSATAGWLLGLGEPLDVVTPATASTPEVITQVTLVPLGLTALVLVLLAGGIRRARVDSVAAAAGVVLTAVAGLWLAYTFAESAPTSRGVLTQAGVVVLALLVGMRSRLAGLRLKDPRLREVAEWVVAGLRAGAFVLVGLGVLGALIVLGAVLTSLSDVVTVHRALGPDVVSTVVLVLAQVAALVTLVAWGVAWLAGPGFVIGAVSVTPVAATEGPLPALPVLAGIPDAGPGPGRWVAAVVVGLALVVLVRPLGRTRGWIELATTAGVAVVAVALTGGALAGLSSGEIGALSPVGASGTAVLLALAGEVALGALLATGVVVGLRAVGRDPGRLGEPLVAAVSAVRERLRPRRRSRRRR